MPVQKQFNLRLPADLLEKAEKESVKLFGKKNVAGYIKYLINKQKRM